MFGNDSGDRGDMGAGSSTLLPAPDERLLKSIKLLDLSNTDLAKVSRNSETNEYETLATTQLGTQSFTSGPRRFIFGCPYA